MNAKQIFNRFIFEKGLRQTSQRQQIADVFLSNERHLTIDELYRIAKKRYKSIGYATVARTVKLMLEAEICREVDFGNGAHRFEHKYGHEHHDHLICVKCGRFVEIHSKKLEVLQEQIVRKHGYVQEYHKLDIFGMCGRCSKSSRK